MTRKDIIEEVVRTCDGIAPGTALRIVKIVFSMMHAAISNREEVEIVRFGKFRTIRQPHRIVKTTGRKIRKRGWKVKFTFSGKVMD